MALTENQKTKINLFVTELERVGEELLRCKVFFTIDEAFATKYFIILKNAGSVQEALQTIIKDERNRYINENIDKLDPATVYDIMSGIMWPSISSVDVAMVDHPSDPNLTSMRGVTVSVIYNENGELNTNLWNLAFNISTDPAHATFGLYQTYYKNMVEEIKSINNESDKKEILNLVFRSEIAAKCWWIGVYGNHPTLGRPANLIASLNAYLGYFAMIVGWLQGSGALQSRGLLDAIKSEITEFPNINSGPLEFDTTKNSLDIKSVSATIKAIQQNYNWLQAQKTHNTNKEYYQGWFDRFFSIPKSTVNMLIIINERVHLNINKEFTYSPKASVRLTRMGAAYATGFELTIGA
jgi:hypothetical protein